MVYRQRFIMRDALCRCALQLKSRVAFVFEVLKSAAHKSYLGSWIWGRGVAFWSYLGNRLSRVLRMDILQLHGTGLQS